eukprot:Hpha_TRINITY_DN16602_c1_g3::TRINITY_DN16602_c1_g3_i5::g.181185::m.181185
MKIVVPAKLLLILAASFSTIVSLVGGLILYLESVRAVEDTVREVAMSETYSAQLPLRAMIDDAIIMNRKQERTMLNWHPFKAPQDLIAWHSADSFGIMNSTPRSRRMAGMQVMVMTNYTGDIQVTRSVGFVSPLTDPDTIAQVGAEETIMTSYTIPELYNVSCGYAGVVEQCSVASMMDRETGFPSSNPYNHSTTPRRNFGEGSQTLARIPWWRSRGGSVWASLGVWYSMDNTPFAYAWFISVPPLIQEPGGMFDNALLVVTTYLSFYEWTRILQRSELQGYVIVVNGANNVLADSTGDAGAVKRDCRKRVIAGRPDEQHPCVNAVSDQPAEVRAAVQILQTQADAVFLRRDLAGTAHWILRRTLFQPREGVDLLDPIYLVWMRSVSSVEDQLLRSLYFFLGFLVAVLVFDLLVMFLEIKWIGRPLGRLTHVVQYIDEMDLDGAAEKLDWAGAQRSSFAISDIQRLLNSFDNTIARLREYRSFLPQAVWVQFCEDTQTECDLEDRRDTNTESKEEKLVSSATSWSTGLQENKPQDVFFAPEAIDKQDDRSSRHSLSGTEAMQRNNSITVRSIITNPLLGGGLEKRRIAMGMLNLLNSLQNDPEQRRERVKRAVEGCVAETGANKGVMEGVTGDRIRCSWNASRNTLRCRVYALTATYRATRGGMSSAVVSGEAMCGAEGVADFRFYTIDGARVSFGFLLERFAAREAEELITVVPHDACVTMCDRATKMDTTELGLHRWYGEVTFAKVGREPVYHVMGLSESSGEGEEWMYELAGRDKSWEVYNGAAVKLAAGDPSATESGLLKLPKATGDSTLLHFYADRLKAHLHNHTRPGPIYLADLFVEAEPLPLPTDTLGHSVEKKQSVEKTQSVEKVEPQQADERIPSSLTSPVPPQPRVSEEESGDKAPGVPDSHQASKDKAPGVPDSHQASKD